MKRMNGLYRMAFVVVFLGLMTSLQAQNAISLGTFEEGRQVSGPLMLSQGEGWKRSLYIYPKEAIAEGLAKSYEIARNVEEFKTKLAKTYEGEAAFYFNSLAMLRVSDEYKIVPNTSKLRIYIKNTEASGFGGAALWKEEVHDAVLVFNGDPSELIGYSNGFTNFYFSKAVPWTGYNLEVIFEFYTSLGNEPNEPLQLAAADNMEGIQFNNDQGLIATGTNHPPADNQFNTSVIEHPDLKLGFTTNVGVSYLPVGRGQIEEVQTSPIRNGATGWNRNMYIYPWTMLSGIKAGSFINSLELYRLNETNQLADGNELRIFVRNCVDYTFDQNASTDWYNLVNDATLVYDGDPKDIVGSASGYKLFPFTNPFQYAGDNLQVFFEYIKTNDNGGNDNMQWAGSNPETDNDLDFNQGMYYMMADGSVPNGNTNLSNFAGTIPTLRLGNTSAGVAKQALTDVSASNGAVINNGKRTYIINQLLYKPNKGEAITDDQPFTASNGKVYHYNYVLLHKLAKSGNSNEQYLQGKLTARMGSNVVENHKIDLDINTSAGNLQNAGSMVSYGDPASLVSLKYNNENYMAVAIPIYTDIQSSLTDFSYTGYAQNSTLQLIAGSDLNNVEFESVKAFRNSFDPATNISSTANKMVVSGGLVVGRPSGNNVTAKMEDNDNDRTYFINQPILRTNKENATSDNPLEEGPCFLLLHEAVTKNGIILNSDGTDIKDGFEDHHVMGKITGIRGGKNTWNRKWTVEVNTASAYNRNRGSVLTYNENESIEKQGKQNQLLPVPSANLVIVYFEGKAYMALKIPTNSALWGFSFTGYAHNPKLEIVTTETPKFLRDKTLSFPDLLTNKGDVKDEDFKFTSATGHDFIIHNEQDPIGVQGDLSVLNNLTLQQFKGEESQGKTLTVDKEGNIILNKASGKIYNFKNATLDENLPANNNNRPQIEWFKMGTLTIPQGGYNATIKMYAGSGFNGIKDQNGSVELFIRTSNGGADYLTKPLYATATHFGQKAFIEQIQIVIEDASSNKYDVYVKAGNFIGNGYYTVDTYGGEWLEDCSPASKDQNPTDLSFKVFNVPFELRTSDKVFIGDCSTHTGNYQLDVAGKIRADKLTVNTTGADFVFNSSYHLPALKTVEQFVKKEHHLPGIASAKEMQTDGLDVGDNQTKLLQKVEELTLYVIELHKELEKLKRRKTKK